MNPFKLLLPGHLPVSFITMRDAAILPERSTPGSAGYDLFLPKDAPTVELLPGASHVFPLGYGIRVPRGFYLSLQTRSGMSIKHGIVLANGTEGVIDSDYRGEIMLALYNRSTDPYTLSAEDKVAQGLFKQHYNVVPIEGRLYQLIYDRQRNHRGQGGLGSTGKI